MALQDDLLRLVPIAILHGILQISAVMAIQILKDAVLVLQSSERRLLWCLLRWLSNGSEAPLRARNSRSDVGRDMLEESGGREARCGESSRGGAHSAGLHGQHCVVLHLEMVWTEVLSSARACIRTGESRERIALAMLASDGV